MPTVTNIVLADSVPANHTFQPVSVTTAASVLIDRATNIAEGNPTLILGFNMANTKRKTDRVDVRLNFPIERQVDGVWVVTDTARFIGQWIVPVSMTQTERDNFEALADNLVSHSVVEGYIADRNPFYG